MRGKPVDYLWSFLIGGALRVAAQMVFELLLSAGVEFGLSITLMLAIMAALSGATTILGQYQKLEDLGGFGAMLPFTGFSAAIIEFTAAALKEGDTLLRTSRKALSAAFLIFGVGLPVAFGAALLMSFR